MGTVDRNAVVMRAREARRAMTLPEGILWQILHSRPRELKFRRQHPIGSYVVDFYCAAARLVVEVDGVSHDMSDRPAHDVRRDQWLRDQGLRVIRFDAGDVLKDPESTVTAILLATEG